MNDTAYALAIDLGTSGPKAAVVSTSGHTIGTARSSVTTIRLADGGVEQDPEEIWAAVRSASKAAIEAADVVLMRSDPLDVPVALTIGRGTLRKMRQNLGWIERATTSRGAKSFHSGA